MTYTTTATNSAQPEVQVAPASLENQIKAALEHARRLTAMNGTDNIEVAIAWETVEELRKAQRQQPAAISNTLTRYCADHPEAPECRIYED